MRGDGRVFSEDPKGVGVRDGWYGIYRVRGAFGLLVGAFRFWGGIERGQPLRTIIHPREPLLAYAESLTKVNRRG